MLRWRAFAVQIDCPPRMLHWWDSATQTDCRWLIKLVLIWLSFIWYWWWRLAVQLACLMRMLRWRDFGTPIDCRLDGQAHVNLFHSVLMMTCRWGLAVYRSIVVTWSNMYRSMFLCIDDGMLIRSCCTDRWSLSDQVCVNLSAFHSVLMIACWWDFCYIDRLSLDDQTRVNLSLFSLRTDDDMSMRSCCTNCRWVIKPVSICLSFLLYWWWRLAAPIDCCWMIKRVYLRWSALRLTGWWDLAVQIDGPPRMLCWGNFVISIDCRWTIKLVYLHWWWHAVQIDGLPRMILLWRVWTEEMQQCMWICLFQRIRIEEELLMRCEWTDDSAWKSTRSYDVIALGWPMLVCNSTTNNRCMITFAMRPNKMIEQLRPIRLETEHMHDGTRQ